MAYLLSFQKNKYENNNNSNTSKTTINTSIIAKRRGRPPGKRVIQSFDISPIKGAVKGPGFINLELYVVNAKDKLVIQSKPREPTLKSTSRSRR